MMADFPDLLSTETTISPGYTIALSGDYRVPTTVESFWIFTDVIYVLMGILILVGNAINVCAILKFPQLRKVVSNVFVVSLSLADAIIFLSCLFYPVKKHSPWNKESARAFQVLIVWPSFICAQMSLLTHVVIAVDRLLAVTLAMRYRMVMTKKRAVGLVALTWTYALFYTGMITLYYGYTANVKLLLLNISFVVYTPRTVVNFLMVQTWLIISLIVLIYIFIYFKILYQKKKVGPLVNEQTAENPEKSGYERRMRKTTRMMATIVSFLLICFLPFSIFTFISSPFQPNYQYIFQTLHIILTVNSCINPIIYCWLHSEYRKAYAILIGIKSRKESTTTTTVSASMHT